MTGLNRGLFLFMLYAFLTNGLLSGTGQAGNVGNDELARPGIRFNLNHVRYMGKDTYRVELAFENETALDLDADSFVNEFSVQSEVIGRWIPLTVAPAAKPGPASERESHADPGQVKALVVKIPRDLPRMYRNMDGEVNLRIVSRPAGRTGPGQDLPMDPERFYWVPLESGQWVLREGM